MINLASFSCSRGPLFSKSVSWFGPFFAVFLQQTGSHTFLKTLLNCFNLEDSVHEKQQQKHILTLLYVGFLSLLSHVGGGVRADPPPLVSQLWDPKIPKLNFPKQIWS